MKILKFIEFNITKQLHSALGFLTLVIFLKGNLKKHFKIKGTKLLTEKNSLGKVSF